MDGPIPTQDALNQGSPNQAAPTLPSWLASACLHAVLIVMLLLLLRHQPRGAVEEPDRSGGIVLRQVRDDGEFYEDQSDHAQQQSADQATQDAITTELQEAAVAALPAVEAGPDISADLPAMPVIGAGPRPGGGVGNAQQATQAALQPRRASGGKARVRFYDLEGEGSKFVFVLDRSESMRGNPLANAKHELIRSLASLESMHQFQILFFNHQLRAFDLTGGQNRVAFATDETKQLAARFVADTTASGGTDTSAAVLRAVLMRPDVIFLLTDAEDALSAAQLDKIRRRNADRASINVVQLGQASGAGSGSYLKRLARQNGGRYVYMNVSRLRAAPPADK
jgi:Mg-chelatase subunit ChlD